jgi:proline dehydrogenase
MKLPFFLARRFVAAETLEDTLPVVRRLHGQGLRVTLDHLGEHISDRRLAEQARDGYLDLVRTLGEAGGALDRNISIKLSMLGQQIDEAFCEDNLHLLLTSARDQDVFVRIDMEGSAVTASTLEVFEKVFAVYPLHVGIVLQAYLKRTREDVERMCELNARVRLCKGAYREPASVAHQRMDTIREHFAEYMETLVTRGNYPGIATHDDILIKRTKAFVAERGIGNDRFEFQMLYGIRPDTQVALASSGYNMRVYVPYGRMWVPYFSRRLRERKENIFFVLRNLFRG